MVPYVFRNLIHFELMKLDKCILPMMTAVTWSSSGAMDIMQEIINNMNYTERFIKMV